MKKLLFALVSLLAITSCSKTDLYDPDNQMFQDAAKTNAEKVLGFQPAPTQDWCTTVSRQVRITADASVKRVQLLVNVIDIDDETLPSYVTRNAMRVLNQAETNGQTSLTLYYDAPKDNLGLYVGFVTADSYILRKVENGAASMAENAKTRGQKLTSGSMSLRVFSRHGLSMMSTPFRRSCSIFVLTSSDTSTPSGMTSTL